MTITLVRRMASVPPGYSSDEVKSDFASLDEATAQAVADVQSGAETVPIRIMEGDELVLDKNGIMDAVAKANDEKAA